MQISLNILEQCHSQLRHTKAELMNRYQSARRDFSNSDFKGDEIDNSVALLAENHYLVSQERIRMQILEVDLALARIEQGCFGFCEETNEPIESERLLVIPWTRLSIEGAEIREDMKARFAR